MILSYRLGDIQDWWYWWNPGPGEINEQNSDWLHLDHKIHIEFNSGRSVVCIMD